MRCPLGSPYCSHTGPQTAMVGHSTTWLAISSPSETQDKQQEPTEKGHRENLLGTETLVPVTPHHRPISPSSQLGSLTPCAGDRKSSGIQLATELGDANN